MAPTWAENTIFALVDDGNEMFIGRYIMEKREWEVLLPVSLFQEKLDEQIDASLFRNFRMMIRWHMPRNTSWEAGVSTN